MSLTATSVLLMKLGSTEKNWKKNLQSAHCPVAHCDEIPVPIFGKLPDISDEDASSVERQEDEEEVVLEDDAPHPFSQKELHDLVCDLSLSMNSAELLASRLTEKTSTLTVLASAYSATGIKSTSLFLYSEGLGVLCRYCAASAQVWSGTVWTQRSETVHWQQQVITEMCSATQR